MADFDFAKTGILTSLESMTEEGFPPEDVAHDVMLDLTARINAILTTPEQNPTRLLLLSELGVPSSHWEHR